MKSMRGDMGAHILIRSPGIQHSQFLFRSGGAAAVVSSALAIAQLEIP